MACICVGPKGSGKTHLLSALKNESTIDITTHSVSTVGTNIFKIAIPNYLISGLNQSNKKEKYSTILEIGGCMAPLWRKYFNNVNKIIYVVDTSNLCQISCAGVLLYSIMADPRLQKTKFLLVLTKMDLAYRQMRNEALLMLQMAKLKKQLKQNLVIVEASPITRDGFEDIYKWLDTVRRKAIEGYKERKSEEDSKSKTSESNVKGPLHQGSGPTIDSSISDLEKLCQEREKQDGCNRVRIR
ncbi:ADP-ribosylation factor-like protein 16 [Condylostylus longicornis]|uniref:ADP-ribosylation factor-like protein 16 n=1 Tax=Condylostylus longicornis TaxID=2530218 RepID=UPI00244DF4F4|nr:ADP-ribosylation factor-like protein 16 [Condylostylus longicornis]